MYVSVYQSLFGFYVINKLMTLLLGEYWKSRVLLYLCWVGMVFFPIAFIASVVNERDRKEEVNKDLYLNARNDRIRATNRREDWDKFDFEDPNW